MSGFLSLAFRQSVRVTDCRDSARRAVLADFLWTGGHADFGGVLRSANVIETIGPALADSFRRDGISAVVAVEARGFTFGALAAAALGVGLVLARKPGSIHPGALEEAAEAEDWRGQRHPLRISRSALRPRERLLLVDDWIETGNQARTVARLLERLGAELVGVSAVVDDTTDLVRSELNVVGLLRSSDLPPWVPRTS